ncbi:DinB family protein [Streptomyces sp. RKND-216]|uniref:DinB family protein n=1 Tax=Streptomyces sp. RKND-216 TaxID=2562581 RepID=UPI001FF7FF5A|nr:DinB family protein [Streptomyces sp. RKND-216]
MADTTDPEQTPTRTFAWEDMFVHPDDDPRSQDPYEGERATLTGYLRDQRLTLEMKCAGLDAERMARRSVPPSNMSLLGLVRHLAGVEHAWFRKVLAGEQGQRPFRRPDERDWDFDGAVGDVEAVEEAWRVWRQEVAFAERFAADAPSMDLTVEHDGQPLSLREVLVHMIEEYARHNGHADLLRERIDGRVGE